MNTQNLIPELYVADEYSQTTKEDATNLKSWDLTPRQICDLELIMSGGFYPLNGFLGQQDYKNVVENMRLSSGALWPIPITLDVSHEFSTMVEEGQNITLRDLEGVALAVLTISDKWSPNKKYEAEKVFGTNDIKHPAVNYLRNIAGPVYLGGQILGLQKPVHYDFRSRRDTPNELRTHFHKLGWKKIVAFQTRNPLHRAHQTF
jgi:sulfate adenylyltransferase